MRDSRAPRKEQVRESSPSERRTTKAGKRPRTKKKPLRDPSHEQGRVKRMENASMPAEDHARKSTQAREKKKGDRSQTPGRADRKSIKQERETKTSKMDNKKKTKSKAMAPQSRDQPQLDQESSTRNSKAWTFLPKKNTTSIELKTKSVISSPKTEQLDSFVVDKEAKSKLSKSSPTAQEQHASILAMISDLSDLSSVNPIDRYEIFDGPVEERDEMQMTRASSQSDARQDLSSEEKEDVSPNNDTRKSSGSDFVTTRESIEKLESIRSTLSESAREPQMMPSLLEEDTLGTSFATEDPEVCCFSNFDSGINLLFESTNSVLRCLGVQGRV